MDTTVEETETNAPTIELKHEFGKLAVGTVAGFVADHLARKAYAKALTLYRVRKVR